MPIVRDALGTRKNFPAKRKFLNAATRFPFSEDLRELGRRTVKSFETLIGGKRETFGAIVNLRHVLRAGCVR
jgi:hypothetical protein